MGGSFKGKKTHYDDKAIGSTYDNPGVGKGAKGKRGTGRNASDRFAPKGFGNVGCYDEEKYLNNGKSLKSGKPSNANIRDAVAAARAELRNQKDQGAGFFKNKKKKSFNPNFDNDNHNRKNRYNSGDKNERGGRGNQGRGNQGRNEGRGRRR